MRSHPRPSTPPPQTHPVQSNIPAHHHSPQQPSEKRLKAGARRVNLSSSQFSPSSLLLLRELYFTFIFPPTLIRLALLLAFFDDDEIISSSSLYPFSLCMTTPASPFDTFPSFSPPHDPIDLVLQFMAFRFTLVFNTVRLLCFCLIPPLLTLRSGCLSRRRWRLITV